MARGGKSWNELSTCTCLKVGVGTLLKQSLTCLKEATIVEENPAAPSEHYWTCALPGEFSSICCQLWISSDSPLIFVLNSKSLIHFTK